MSRLLGDWYRARDCPSQPGTTPGGAGRRALPSPPGSDQVCQGGGTHQTHTHMLPPGWGPRLGNRRQIRARYHTATRADPSTPTMASRPAEQIARAPRTVPGPAHPPIQRPAGPCALRPFAGSPPGRCASCIVGACLASPWRGPAFWPLADSDPPGRDRGILEHQAASGVP